MFDRLGGLFGFPRARLLQTATTTYLELGDIRKAAESSVEGVRLYENSSPKLRAFGSVAALRIDLGQARMQLGDAEGIDDALRPVLDLPVSHRLDWVSAKLKGFHAKLCSHPMTNSPSGRELALEIEEFFSATVVDNFPGLV